MTLAEILAIPGNRAVYERLQKPLADGSAIAFIGAGASFPLYPLWTELLNRLAGEAIARGLASEADKTAWQRMKNPVQAAAQIRRKLHDSLYEPFLYETFKDRIGGDGRAYTPAQGALVRCNFQAWITTNYDGGLMEARRVLRPDIRDTSFTVSNQTYPMQRWTSGDVFKTPGAHPVLFAHGHFADPASIVLDRESYQKAYRQGPYRRFIENMWLQYHLVFAGFSFNDATLSQVADDVFSQLAARAEPRHIAIIGLDSEQLYTPEIRREYLDSFHAEALFYPVANGDHSALQILLESLASVPEAKPVSAPAPPKVPSAPRFVHETTDDEKFTGRTETLARLDRWPQTRKCV